MGKFDAITKASGGKIFGRRCECGGISRMPTSIEEFNKAKCMYVCACVLVDECGGAGAVGKYSDRNSGIWRQQRHADLD
jgi:hypothetical protein